MIVKVDLGLDSPPYEQIRGAIVEAVRGDELAPGARLPTVRQLARDLDLSPATVARAYRELEHEGIVRGAGRKGTFVVDGAARSRQSVATLARDFVRQARRSGVDRATILQTVTDALD